MPKASKKSSYILGLDLATTCGWALIDEASGKAMTGRWNFAARKADHGVGARYERFLASIEALYTEQEFSCIFYEEVSPRAHKNVPSIRLYNGWVAMVHLFAERYRIPVYPIAVQTIKKHATGSGRADKIEMVAAARQKWPALPIETDDEADAIFTASAGLAALAM